MRYVLLLILLTLAACEVKAEAIKACGEACKSGVVSVSKTVCLCERSH